MTTIVNFFTMTNKPAYECVCAADYENECICGGNWTSPREKKLKMTIEALEKKQKKYKRAIKELYIALHDALRRPVGVVPASAEKFYNADEADRAEVRRLEAKSNERII